MDNQKLNRRKFLKLGALFATVPFIDYALGSRGLIAKDSKNITFSTELVKNGKVITSAHWGILEVDIKDGVVQGSKEWGSSREFLKNPMTTVVKDQIYTKSRIKYPMVRKSFLENKANHRELRGEDEWVKLSFDDAIKLTAKKIMETRQNYGNAGIFAGSYGWQSTGKLHSAQTLLQRLFNLSGGFTGISGDYSTGASQVIMPYVMGSLEVYEQQTSWPLILANSKVIVIWGSNPFATLKLAYSASEGEGLRYFEELKKSGIKTILIDPQYNEMGEFLNSEWIAPIPNTDVAMMLGIMNELYTTNNYDKDFISNYTSGFDKFIPYLKDKTPAWASKICGIPEAKIKSLAKLFRENLTCFMSGWSMQRADHGEQPHWALATLCSMLGTIGKPGGGFGLSFHYSNGGSPTTNAPVAGGMNVGKGPVEGKAWTKGPKPVNIPVVRYIDAILNPGKTIDAKGEKVTYPKIDLIYWAGGNPVNHQQNTNKLIQAWKKVSTIVVNDMYWTASSRMADIVFPICTQYERNDIAMSGDYSNKHIIPQKQLVEKQFESISDYDVFAALAKELNIYDEYTEGGKTEMQWLEEFYNKAYETASKIEGFGDENGDPMPDFATFWNANKPLTFAPTQEGEEFVRHGEFIDDPILNPLGTTSGLIEIYSTDIAKYTYDECPPHPTWIEPTEWLGMKKKTAEFHMVSPHPKYRLHSQLNNTSLRDGYKVNDREPIRINTKDAKRKGIKNGDIVRVYNSRGQILAGAVVTDKIIPGVVSLYEGGWYSPKGGKGKDKDLCLNGCPNPLTLDKSTSQLANGNISNTVLVNIEKYKGKAPKPTVFNELG